MKVSVRNVRDEEVVWSWLHGRKVPAGGVVELDETEVPWDVRVQTRNYEVIDKPSK